MNNQAPAMAPSKHVILHSALSQRPALHLQATIIANIHPNVFKITSFFNIKAVIKVKEDT